ncbi:MAG: class I tRNA ligase family protein [Nitrospiraceae bacterium]|nr:class I tRNA ligase family protein [Nitrospiraceae bacterium]
MLKIYNTLSRRIEKFSPASKKRVTIFTCGPSVYQRSHIGNFRTFLFEDIVLRHLEFSGYSVTRCMNYTDIEDKAITEASKRGLSVKKLTESNIKIFHNDMKMLRLKTPDCFPLASEHVNEAARIISELLRKKIAYRHGGNIYFDPLKYKGFGRLFGLDMSKWPKKKKRFHKDTYPGIQWNLGDFILWHGYRKGDAASWDTELGMGRPSWNVQDPSMITPYFNETLSIYCGGIDNLYRHHDYNMAILESIRPYKMSKYWMHCMHLYVNGSKMSKSKGNILYTDDLIREGFSAAEARFFLIYSHYRKRLNFSSANMQKAAKKISAFRKRVKEISKSAAGFTRYDKAEMITAEFTKHMDNDIDMKSAFDSVDALVSSINPRDIKPAEAGAVIKALKKIDTVMQVIF